MSRKSFRLYGAMTLLSRDYVIKWEHFSVTVLCKGNSPVTGGFPLQGSLKRSFDVFFDLRLNKRLSKQSRGRWFEKPSRSLWHHCNMKMQSCKWVSSTAAQAHKLLQSDGAVFSVPYDSSSQKGFGLVDSLLGSISCPLLGVSSSCTWPIT